MRTYTVKWGESCVVQAFEHLEAAAQACNPDRAYDIGGQSLTGQDLQCLLDIVRQCDSQHSPVREQLLAALPDEWDTDQPTLADVADAVRDKLKHRTADCERVLEALLPVLREHPLSKDDVQDDNLRAGDIAKIAAEALQWQTAEIDQLTAEVERLKNADADELAWRYKVQSYEDVLVKGGSVLARLLNELGVEPIPRMLRPLAERVVTEFKAAVEERGRLREQLATAAVLPHEYEMLERVLRAMQGPNFRGVEHCRDYDDVEFEAAESVVREIRLWGVATSEAEAPQPQEMAQHKVVVVEAGLTAYVAGCTTCKTSVAGSKKAAEDWRDQHEADTLRLVLTDESSISQRDEGRPSGSKGATPQSVGEWCDPCQAHVTGSHYHCAKCGQRSGMLGHSMRPCPTEPRQDAASAARSEATRESPVDASGMGPWMGDDNAGRRLRVEPVVSSPVLPMDPGDVVEPSPSPRKEGEDRG